MEVLTPDFCGDLQAVARVLDAGPHVFNHNIETVPRLYRRVRPQADYRQSLDVLDFARRYRPDDPDQIRLDGGPGRNRGRSAQRCCATCALPEPTWPPSASICSPRAAICRSPSISTPRQFDAYRDYGLSLGFQDGLQRPAGAQFLHGGPGERSSAARRASA